MPALRALPPASFTHLVYQCFYRVTLRLHRSFFRDANGYLGGGQRHHSQTFPLQRHGVPYKSLVCAKEVFGIRPALKDVWAFIVSLLAVRSEVFSNTSANYYSLVRPKLGHNMFISQHRDAAAFDFWGFRMLPDGTLVPPSPCTSSEVYKIIIAGVYREEAFSHSGDRLYNFVEENVGFSQSHIAPAPTGLGLIEGIASNLQKVSHAPQKLPFHQMANS